MLQVCSLECLDRCYARTQYVPKFSSDVSDVALFLRLLLGGFFPVNTRLADPKFSFFVIKAELRPRENDGVQMRRAEPPRPNATGRFSAELGVAHFMNEPFMGVNRTSGSISSSFVVEGGGDCGVAQAGEAQSTFFSGNRDRHVSK